MRKYLLTAAIGLGFVTSAIPAHASIILSLQGNPVAVTGGYDYTYTATLSSDEQLDKSVQPVFFTLYDFGAASLIGATGDLAATGAWAFTLNQNLTTYAQAVSPNNTSFDDVRATYKRFAAARVLARQHPGQSGHLHAVHHQHRSVRDHQQQPGCPTREAGARQRHQRHRHVQHRVRRGADARPRRWRAGTRFADDSGRRACGHGPQASPPQHRRLTPAGPPPCVAGHPLSDKSSPSPNRVVPMLQQSSTHVGALDVTGIGFASGVLCGTVASLAGYAGDTMVPACAAIAAVAAPALWFSAGVRLLRAIRRPRRLPVPAATNRLVA